VGEVKRRKKASAAKKSRRKYRKLVEKGEAASGPDDPSTIAGAGA
jgi:hypothetical protein